MVEVEFENWGQGNNGDEFHYKVVGDRDMATNGFVPLEQNPSDFIRVSFDAWRKGLKVQWDRTAAGMPVEVGTYDKPKLHFFRYMVMDMYEFHQRLPYAANPKHGIAYFQKLVEVERFIADSQNYHHLDRQSRR